MFKIKHQLFCRNISLYIEHGKLLKVQNGTSCSSKTDEIWLGWGVNFLRNFWNRIFLTRSYSKTLLRSRGVFRMIFLGSQTQTPGIFWSGIFSSKFRILLSNGIFWNYHSLAFWKNLMRFFSRGIEIFFGGLEIRVKLGLHHKQRDL